MKKKLIISLIAITLASTLQADNIRQLEKEYQSFLNKHKKSLGKQVGEYLYDYGKSKLFILDRDISQEEKNKQLKSIIKRETNNINKMKERVKKYDLIGQWSYLDVKNKKYIFAINELGFWSDDYKKAKDLPKYVTSLDSSSNVIKFQIWSDTVLEYDKNQVRKDNCFYLKDKTKKDSKIKFKLCRIKKTL